MSIFGWSKHCCTEQNSISKEVGGMAIRETTSSACYGVFPALTSGSWHSAFKGGKQKLKVAAQSTEKRVKAGQCRGATIRDLSPISLNNVVRIYGV